MMGKQDFSSLGKYSQPQPLERGVTFLRQAKESSKPGEGIFYAELIKYMTQYPKEFATTGLTRTEDNPSSSNPCIDPQRRMTLLHEDGAVVYIGVPTNTLQEIIGISGKPVARACATCAIKGLVNRMRTGDERGNLIDYPLEDLPYEEGMKYFNLSQQSLKTISEEVKV